MDLQAIEQELKALERRMHTFERRLQKLGRRDQLLEMELSKIYGRRTLLRALKKEQGKA